MSVPRKQDGWRPGTPQDLEAMYQFKKRFRELKMLLELIESGKLDMKVIRGLLPPEMDSDAANKKYVDDGLAKKRPNTWNPSFLTDKDQATYRNGLQYSGSPTNPLYMAVWDYDDTATGTQPNRRVRSIDAEGAREVIGAAPAGYGLGTTGKVKTIQAVSELDAILQNGWYTIYAPTMQYIGGIPFHSVTLEVSMYNSAQGHQTVRFIGNNTVCRRAMSGGDWRDWEFDNPPMELGVEYRTTERYNGKPVYVKVVSLGALTANTAKAVAYSSDANCRAIRVGGGVTNGAANQTGLISAVSNGAVSNASAIAYFGSYCNYAIVKYPHTVSNVDVTVAYYKTTD